MGSAYGRAGISRTCGNPLATQYCMVASQLAFVVVIMTHSDVLAGGSAAHHEGEAPPGG